MMSRSLVARPESIGDQQFRAKYSLSVNMMCFKRWQRERERGSVHPHKIIPGKGVFTIKREGTMKVWVVGCGSF